MPYIVFSLFLILFVITKLFSLTSRADPGAPTNLGDSLLCPHSGDHRPLQVCPQKGCHSPPVHWRRPYRGQHHCGQVRWEKSEMSPNSLWTSDKNPLQNFSMYYLAEKQKLVEHF